MFIGLFVAQEQIYLFALPWVQIQLIVKLLTNV